jgi:hypothetical protein
MKYSEEIRQWIAAEGILGTDSEMIARAASNKFKQKISAREVRTIIAGYTRRERKDSNGKEMDTRGN